MKNETFTTEQLIAKWEAQRAVKNLMGKYVNAVLLNRDQDVFELFWAAEEDVCLGFNDGWYRGVDAVKGYYAACCDRNKLVAKVLQQHFPEKLADKSDDEIYGIGTMKIYPLYSPIIEIASDKKTAKGLWSCLGSHCDVDPIGPLSRYLWGYYAVDFINTEEGWKIWHMQFVHDLDGVVGQNWGQPDPEYPELPEFAPLKAFAYPEYTQKQTIRNRYSPVRVPDPAPRIPEAYDTFAETFSYAVKEA